MQGENDTDSRDTNQIRILRERIAELEASVAELAKARKESDLIIELVPDLIAVASTDGYFKRLNPAWEETLGFTTDELLSKPFVNFIHPDDVERTMKEVEQQLSGERTICFENRYLCRNGEYKWLEWVATPVVDNTLLFATARDITERKKSETALREGEERFRKLFDTSHDVIVFLDREGNIMDINHHGEELTHYTRAELLRMNAFSDLILPEDHLIMRNVVRDAFEGRESRYVERWKTRDGKIIYFDGLTVPQRSSGGDVLSTFCSLRDITQHKMADDALKASEERFRAISSAAVDAVILTDGNGRIVYWNAASERMFGYPSEEAIGQDLHLLLAPAKYHEDFKKGFDRFRRTGQGLSIGNTMEFTAIRKDGSEFPIEVSTSAILIDGLWSAVGIVRDVTERTKAEDALRASEEELHYNYLLQSAVNMILSESLKEVSLETILQKALNIVVSIPEFSFEPIGCILLVEDEPGILKMKARSNLVEPDAKLCDAVPFGWCFCGRAAADRKLLFADHMDTRHEICHTAMPQHGHYAVPILFGGRTMGLLNIYLREGHANSKEEEEFLVTVANNLAGIIMRRRAEEEKERLHEQLLQAQKMEAIGQLAGGIAHDFNNILTAMIGYGHLLKMKMEEDDPLRNYVEHMLLLSDRAANLTQGLLAFSRKQIMNPEAVDLNAVIRRVERLLERIIGEDIELRTDLADKDLIILADPLQIEQMLMNLATNAKDAMPAGGQLVIRTEPMEINGVFIKAHGFGKPGRYALVSFSDTGAGIDEKTKQHIFEPFFTTKEVGKGTGLGLAMVYGIIKQHEGYVNVYSEPGEGTTFSLYLPLVDKEAAPTKPDETHALERGTEVILLAEDNNEVRTSTKRILEEFGYEVIEAMDGEDAVGKFRMHADRIQFLILDMIMPKKNGKETFEEIRKMRPDLRAIFTSGYTADIIQKKGLYAGNVEILLKPIAPQILLRKIRENLEKKQE